MSRELKSLTRVLVFVFGLAVALAGVFAWTQLASAPSAYAVETTPHLGDVEEGGYAIKIDLDIQNGKVTADKTSANEGDDVTITATPAAGYRLKLIKLEGDMVEPMTSTTSPYKFKMPDTMITVQAEFEPAPTYAITVTADPAAGGTASADKTKASQGETVTLTAKAADGYEFVEWVPVTKDITIADNKFTMPGSAAEVKATFKTKTAAQYAITYDANGGAGTMTAQTVEAGKSATLMANAFKRDGYTFTGWNTAKDGKGTAYADKATVTPTADMTLYAQWQAAPAQYTITYDANGGAGTMSAQTIEAGKSAALTANGFARDGYTFTGWNTAKDGSGTAYADKATVTPTADMTLYAQWQATPAKYTVTFDANGGTGTMDALTVDAGNSVVLTANAFKRDGYTFAGWNTAKDGKGTAYGDKAQITPNGDMTLYAQWKSGSSMAKTGDTVLPIAIGIAVVALIAGIAVALAVRKRRSDR